MKLLGELIGQILYIAPLCILIYKVGVVKSEHEQLKKDLTKLQDDYGVHLSNETMRYGELLGKITDIANVVTRIETKLEERTTKARSRQVRE